MKPEAIQPISPATSAPSPLIAPPSQMDAPPPQGSAPQPQAEAPPSPASATPDESQGPPALAPAPGPAPAPSRVPGPVVASTDGAGSSLGLAEFVALDTMLQAFLADGTLSPAEVQAYQAARTAFMGGEASRPVPVETVMPIPVESAKSASISPAMPSPVEQAKPMPVEDATPAQDDRVAAPAANTFDPVAASIISTFAAVTADRATVEVPLKNAQAPAQTAPRQGASPPTAAQEEPPLREGLAGALDAYRAALLEHDAHHAGARAAGLAGLTGSGSHQVHILPQLMIPHGLRVLSWAAFDREPSEPEQQAARHLMEAGDPASATRDIYGRIMQHATDPAATELRLVWDVSGDEVPARS